MKKLTLFIIGLFVSLFSFAGEVTEAEALQKAQKFMQGKQFKQCNLRRAPSKSSNKNAFYVFNVENKGGFVIVSGDDRTEEILGYSDHGEFNLEDMPSNVKAWMSFYEQSILSLGDQQIQRNSHRASRTKILPLIKTKWNQGKPYNLKCPMDGDSHSLTGCVATALAQVMYYYKWPQGATAAIPEYTTRSRNLFVEALPATTFKWDKMLKEYDSDETGEAADAVAELMRYCGQINEMDYKQNESAANFQHKDKIIELLGYNKNMQEISRGNYNTYQWEEMIYSELSNNRPVLYGGGRTLYDGHYFICDGYDGNGMFHINWGWGGYCDGYFVLSELNPKGRNYSNIQLAIINFKPSNVGEQISVWSDYVNIELSEYNRSSVLQNFEGIGLEGEMKLYDIGDNQSIDWGWALYQKGEFYKLVHSETMEFPVDVVSTSINTNAIISVGDGVNDGMYMLCQVYKMPDESNWNLCKGYLGERLIVEISGTKMIIKRVTSNYIVNNVLFSDIPRINSPLTVTIDLRNEQMSYPQLNIYYWTRKKGEEKWNQESFLSTFLDPGESKCVTIENTPKSYGAFEVKITSDKIGEDVKWTGDIEISDIKERLIDGLSYYCIVNAQKAYVVGHRYLPEKLTIPSSITVDDVSYAVISIKSEAFKECRSIHELTISEGIKTIDDAAFSECDGLQKLTLPSTLIGIGDNAFNYCPYLASVIVRMNDPFTIDYSVFFSEIDATLYVPIGTTAKYKKTKGWSLFHKILEGEPKEAIIDEMTYTCVTGSNIAILTKGNPSASNLIIPSSITVDGATYMVSAIDDKAFYNKNILENLTIPEGVKTIGNSAFAYCYGLKKVDLPSTLTSIGEESFWGSERLSTVIARMENPFAVSNYTFGTNVVIPTLYVPIRTTSKYQATKGWDKFQIILEGEPKETTIGEMTYTYVTGSRIAILTKGRSLDSDLIIPSSIMVDGVSYAVTEIGKEAFSYRGGFVNLTISEGIKTIGNSAFKYCYGLKKVDFPSTLTCIDEEAFWNCNSLSTVIVRMEEPFAISDNVFGIGEDVVASPHTLYVPKGTTEKYQETDGWKSFSKIEENPNTFVIITAKSYTIKYGDDLPIFEYTSEGVEVEGRPLITCYATRFSPVGTYPIVISKGSVMNYNVTYVNGTLTIEKAPLKITAKDYTIKQGQPLPEFEATYEGFKNDETKDVLTKLPTITTTATSASDPDVYDIIVSGAEAQNYDISYVNGKLTITEADGILGISVEHPADVYDLQGNKVRSKMTTLKDLPKGVYIINGRKVLVK